MQWHPLTKCKQDSFGRGAVFRFPAARPFEKMVDFMIIEDSDAPIFYKLICATGYHAGQTELIFPTEAKHATGGVSVAWLQNNWSIWIHQSCKAEDVLYIDYYPSGHDC